MQTNTTTTVEPEASSPKRPKRLRPDEKDKTTRNKPSKSDSTPVDFTQINFAKKTLHVSYHPNVDIMAVAGLNKIYFYESTPIVPSEENTTMDNKRPATVATLPSKK